MKQIIKRFISRQLGELMPQLAGRQAALWLVVAIMLATILPVAAQDTFNTPLVIDGDSGSVTVDNATAIADPAGPTIAGVPPNSTVWFQWSSTNSGEVSFDTIGTVFDTNFTVVVYEPNTVMGAYTGTQVDKLSVLAANDDLYATPQRNYVGQNFYTFANSTNFGNGNALSNAVLNPPLLQPSANYSSISQPFSGGFSGLHGPSAIRFNAVAGKTYYIAVDVKFSFINSLVSLNWSLHPSGVFRFATENSDLNGLTYEDGFTPVLLYQCAATESVFPRWTPGLLNFSPAGALVTVTRVAGSSGRVTVDYATEDLATNLLFADTNNVGFLINGDLPAVAGSDYSTTAGTITFDDHEMSKSILIPVSNSGSARPNRVFGVRLTNPQVDLAESDEIAPPRVDQIFGLAVVRILDVNLDPRSIVSLDVTNLPPGNTNTVQIFKTGPTNSVFNFQKANYQVYRAGENRTFQVWVNRTGTNNTAQSIFYNVNTAFPFFKDFFVINGNNLFPLTPGSDYATPQPINSTSIQDKVADFNFPGGYSGTLSWGANDRQPKVITFNVLANNLSQFNEDFQISLYDLDSNGNPLQLGMVPVCTVTILPADNVEGQTSGNLHPPAGSVDELYNVDHGSEFLLNTTPPNMEHPGTDGEIFGVAIQPDDKAIVVGDFFSYDQAVRHSIARTLTNGYLDTTFNPGDGANDFITSVIVVTNGGKILIGGAFTSYNGVQRNGVARVNSDGTLDTSFNPGAGVNGTVWALVQQLDGHILIGGDFTTYNGVTRNHMARLNADGTLDATYDPGTTINGPVYAIAVQADTSINASRGSAGGQAADYNLINVGVPSGVVTIDYDMLGQPDDLKVYYGTTNGLLIYDTGFISFTGHLVIPFGPTNGVSTNIITIVMNQTGGEFGTLWSYTASVVASGASEMTVGGDFTSVGGVAGQDHIAKLLYDGSMDSTFDPGAGVNGVVYALATQSDGKILVGGEFTAVNGQSLNRIARLTSIGQVDPAFYGGVGTDGTVYHINYQTNGAVYVGGAFTKYNGTHRLGFARLNTDGTLDTSFLDTAYNQFAGLTRQRYSDPLGTVLSSAVMSDGGVLIGGSFSQVGGGQFTATARPDSYVGANPPTKLTRTAVRNRSNFARLLGGATPGPGNLGLQFNTYSVNKSAGLLFVGLTRTNGFLGPAAANFAVNSGVAQSGVDYLYAGDYNGTAPMYGSDWSFTRMHSDAVYGGNAVPVDDFGVYGPATSTPSGTYVNLTITGDTNSLSDLSAGILMANPATEDQLYLGGENIALGVALGVSSAPLTLIEDRHQSGVLSFAANSYTASSNAPIAIRRDYGSYGAVSVQYVTTTNGSTAIKDNDYRATSGTLTFTAGQTNRSFNVPILQSNYVSQIEKTVNLIIFNAQGPVNGLVSLGQTNAVLRIINANFQGYLNWSTNNYDASLNAGYAAVTVTRTVGSKGSLTVKCASINGSALAGTDFTGFTNTVLSWNNDDVSPRTINVPLLPNNNIGGSKTFNVSIYSPTLNGTNALSLLGLVTNATVNIFNDNSYGTFQFSSPTYVVNEGAGQATLVVNRSGSDLGAATLDYTTYDGGALSNLNYAITAGQLTYTQGQLSAIITVPITNDAVANPAISFTVGLSNAPSGATLGAISNATVELVDASTYLRPPGDADSTFEIGSGMNSSVLALALQPSGQILAGGTFTTVNGTPENYLARLNLDGTLDSSGFLNGLTGLNGPVYALVSQTDDRVVVGGTFTSANGVVRNRLTRLLSDGSVDTSFNPGSGADNAVYALAETFVNGSRKIYVAGSFNNVNSVASRALARLNDNGTVDAAFNTGAGPSDVVYAVAVYATNSVNAGKLMIGGSFTTVNNFNVQRIARLNSDGSVDASFDLNLNANGTVRTIAIQNDGKVVFGGDFTEVNGTTANHVARLNLDGSLDTDFVANGNGGANGSVLAVSLQADNRIIVAGSFTQANGVTRARLTRLQADGKVDPSINFGAGANASIHAAVIQPADGMIVFGGAFTQYDGAAHQHIARIYGSSQQGSGAFTFPIAIYQAEENSAYATISIRRTGGSSGPNSDGSGDISVTVSTLDGTAIDGFNYSNVSTTVIFPPGETFKTVTVPVIDDHVITDTLLAYLTLSSPTSPAMIGNQGSAILEIINDDNAVAFSSANYSVAKNVLTGFGVVNVVRLGGTFDACTVDLVTTTNGTAIAGVDYYPTNTTITFNAGESNKAINVRIVNNPLPNGNQTVVLLLTNAVNTVQVDPTNATLTIVDTVNAPGQLAFASATFVVGEGDTNAYLTVIRSNGNAGIVTVNYATVSGTAVPGVNYTTASGTLSFGDTITNQTIIIPLVDNVLVQGPLNFVVKLSAPAGGATLVNPTNASVTVLDNDVGFRFENATNLVPENYGFANVNVLRLYNTNTAVSVEYRTFNGSAVAGINYSNQSGTLTFDLGETIKSVSIPVVEQTNVTGDLIFTMSLSNAIGGKLTSPSNTVVVVQDADAGISFTNSTMRVLKNAGYALITVVCSNPRVEPVIYSTNDIPLQVDYYTANGTALAGIDYQSASGTLVFTNGIATNTFTVPIYNNSIVTGDRTFSVVLTNVTDPGQLTPYRVQSVVIAESNSGLRFSQASYQAFKNGITKTIDVYRTGNLENAVTVNYIATNGTAIAGVNFIATNGILVFTNGVTSQSFNVGLIANSQVQPNLSVLLQLLNPTNGVLVTPSAATLTILENSGSYVIPAGSALAAESGPVNGLIDSNETVQVLFAFRDSAGLNVTNLVAYLLATNGVTLPSPASQVYGPLTVYGHSATRPFTFKAIGTNTLPIMPTFNLYDNAKFIGSAAFTYTMGSWETSFTNGSAIIILDNTNASPYPSVISVTNIGNTLLKATVTLDKLRHTAPGDIGAAVVTPSLQNVLLMAHAGAQNAVTNIVLTFDDAATNGLSQGSRLTTSTNRPTQYLPIRLFP